MYAVPVTSRSEDLDKILALYISAFPESERSPFELLLDDSTHCSEVFAFYDGETFLGFMSLLTIGDISHIIYFCVDKSLRGRGYGGEALKLLRRIKPNHRLIADIEIETSSAQNNSQRSRRRHFYLKNGYLPSSVSYFWRDELFEILSCGGDLSEREFGDFWDSAEKINPEFSKF